MHFCSTIVTSVGYPHCRQLQARAYFCKPPPSPGSGRASPAVVAPATGSSFPLPRTRQGRRGPDAEARARGARDGSGEGSFHSPLPLPEARLLLAGRSFLLRHHQSDPQMTQSRRGTSSKARPLMVFRFLPAHTGVTSEERTAMKRVGGAAHLCTDSLPESQQQDGNHAPSFSSHSSCRRRQRRRHDKALHAR